MHPHDRERVAAAWNQALETGEKYDIEYRIQAREGDYRTVAVRGVPVRDDDGKVSEWIGSYRDITERQRADESARNWELLIQLAHFGVVASDADTHAIVAVNAACARLLGYRPDELVGKSLLDIIAPEALPDLRRALANEDKFHHVFETKCLRRNGESFPALIDITVRDREGRLTNHISYIQDLSQQKRYQTELEMLYETMPIGVCLLDRDLRFLRLNQALAEINGVPAAQSIGRTVGEVAPWVADEIETRCRHILETGEPVLHVEMRRARPDDPKIARDWLASFFPIQNAAGAVETINFVMMDITELKRAQRELQEHAEQLRVHNEDLRQFARAASHDLQEPLRMVVTFTQLLADRYKDKLDPSADFFIDNAVQGAMRIRNLLDGLREFWQLSERNDQPQIPVPLSVAVHQALGNLSGLISESDVEVTYPPDLPTISAHPVLLVQLFQNVIDNAIRFRTAGRRPEIRISAERQGSSWLISVADNGIGIDPQYSGQIFQIFKRLHGQRYPGAGIGLALCQRIVARYGGRIWADSELGVGSTFRFLLPADTNQAA